MLQHVAPDQPSPPHCCQAPAGLLQAAGVGCDVVGDGVAGAGAGVAGVGVGADVAGVGVGAGVVSVGAGVGDDE